MGMYMCERHQRDRRRWDKRKAHLHAVSRKDREKLKTDSSQRRQKKEASDQPSCVRMKEKWGRAKKHKDRNHA